MALGSRFPVRLHIRGLFRPHSDAVSVCFDHFRPRILDGICGHKENAPVPAQASFSDVSVASGLEALFDVFVTHSASPSCKSPHLAWPALRGWIGRSWLGFPVCVGNYPLCQWMQFDVVAPNAPAMGCVVPFPAGPLVADDAAEVHGCFSASARMAPAFTPSTPSAASASISASALALVSWVVTS